VAVPDAQCALSVLTDMRPDVLVSDISMPGHDGLWLLEAARGRGLLRGVPSLAVTGSGRERRRVLAAGFDAYLVKPVDADDLCTTVHALARQCRPLGDREPW
jgi:CheY-like chemotaxis protein